MVERLDTNADEDQKLVEYNVPEHENKEDIEYLIFLVERLETNAGEDRKLVKELQSLSVESIHGILNRARGTDSFDDDNDYEYGRNLAILLKRLIVKLQRPPKPQVRDEGFTKFAELPQELQDMIWKKSFPNNRVIEFSWDPEPYSDKGSLLFAMNCNLVSAQVPGSLLVSKTSHQIFRENYHQFDFRILMTIPGEEDPSRKAFVNFELDIVYLRWLEEVESLEIYRNGRVYSDFFNRFRRVACSRQSFSYLLEKYIQSLGTSTQLIQDLKKFKILKEIVLVRALELKPCIDVPISAPLVFLPEGANENDAGIEYVTPADTKREAATNRYAALIDCYEKNDDPKAILQLWDRAMEMDGGLKAFKHIKLTFRLAKRDYTPPLSKSLECYWRTM